MAAPFELLDDVCRDGRAEDVPGAAAARALTTGDPLPNTARGPIDHALRVRAAFVGCCDAPAEVKGQDPWSLLTAGWVRAAGGETPSGVPTTGPGAAWALDRACLLAWTAARHGTLADALQRSRSAARMARTESMPFYECPPRRSSPGSGDEPAVPSSRAASSPSCTSSRRRGSGDGWTWSAPWRGIQR